MILKTQFQNPIAQASLPRAPRRAARLLPLVLLFVFTAAAQAQFKYTVDNGTVTITGYDCVNGGGLAAIPGAVAGLPVTGIGDFAFDSCAGLTNVTIPNGVIRIGHGAFRSCTSLIGIKIPDSVFILEGGVLLGLHQLEEC